MSALGQRSRALGHRGIAQRCEIGSPQKSPHSAQKTGLSLSFYRCKSLKNLAPQVGLEPTTLRLTAECSTIELLRSNAGGPFSLQQRHPWKASAVLITQTVSAFRLWQRIDR